MARVIFHIDLNAFFASAEELRHPELKDKPMAIGSLSSRGVLSTANYPAREKGIHSAMPTMQAKALCPELTILPGDYPYYRELSRRFFDYLRQYSGRLEILSVDECYLDVTETIMKYRRPLDLAVAIQQGVLKELGLRCSIGVAPTKFLAKMASDMHKPMGITVLRKSEIARKLLPLPVEDMMGIGKKTVPLLKEKGIRTIGDLADPENRSKVEPVLGRSYYPMMEKIAGRSSDRLSFSSTRKTISHSETFSHDLYTLDEVLSHASRISRDLSQKMRKAGQMGRQISITLRDGEFHNQVRSAPLPDYTNRYETINEAAASLFTQYFEPVGYRLIGITIGSLKNQEAVVLQPTLFEQPQDTTGDIIRRLNDNPEGALFQTAGDLLRKQKAEKEAGAEERSSGLIQKMEEPDDRG